MPFFQKKRPWIKKPPQIVDIDWSNPLTKGLKSAVFFMGGVPRELVNGTNAILVDGGEIGASIHGRVFSGDGNGIFGDFGDVGGVSTDEMSVMVLAKVNSTGRNWFVYKGSPFDTSTGYSLYFWEDGDAYFDIYTSEVEQAAGGITYSTDVWYNVGGYYDGSNTWVEVDGLAGSNNPASGNITNGTDLLTIGSSQDFTDYGIDGDISHELSWDRLLSPKERRAINENPYQILKPRISHLPIPEAAGNTITASQTEGGDSQVATLQVLSQISASQAEAGDAQSALLEVPAQITASQGEAGDGQVAALQILAQILANQIEAGDAQTAAVEALVQISAGQIETGDVTGAAMGVLAQIAASQTEDGDSQTAALLAGIAANITASQAEAGDSQTAAMTAIIQVIADQSEVGDTQAASLQLLVQITVNQLESGDTQIAFILSGSVIVPTGPGLEWTLDDNKLHYSLDGKMEYTLPLNKIHYTLTD